MARLHVHLFGGFLLQSGGTTLPPIPSRTGRALFAYLVVNRGQVYTRELLAGRFWPDMEESRARRRLSQSLWQIQSVIGELGGAEPFIATSPSSIWLNGRSSYWCDVEAFEEAVAESSAAGHTGHGRLETLRNAVTLYRGEFMAGFYDDWIQVEQQRLRTMYFQSVDRLLQVCKSMAAYEEALGYAHRMVVHDPLREESHCEVMRLSYLLGRHNEALFQYERLQALLAEELETEPSPETVALRDEIAAAQVKGDRPFTPVPASPLFEPGMSKELVGRLDERAAMVRRLDEALVGRGGVILVEGESGVGKTHFFTQLAEDANWRGLGTLWGECDPGMRRPYEALRAALDRVMTPHRAEQIGEVVGGVWLREASKVVPRLAELLPDLPPAVPLKPEEEPDRMREALVRVFRALAGVSPQAFFVDDLQWADTETLAVLADLAGVASGAGLLVLVAFRSEARNRPEVWEALRRLDSVRGSDRVVLGPLSKGETAELIRRSSGRAVADSFAEGLYLETGGNALFVLETLRATHEQDLVPSEGALVMTRVAGQARAMPLAPGVAQVISRRIEAAGPAVQPLLAAVAVFGPGATTTALCELLEVGRAEVLTALDETLRRRLLAETEDGYRFSHEQIHRVVYDQLDEERRARLHRVAGEYLEREHPERVEDLAHHFSVAGVSAKATRYLHTAGRRAVDVFAYETAARLLAQAVEHAEDAGLDADDRFELLADHERVLDLLGRREEQEAALDALEAYIPESGARASYTLRRRAWLAAHTSQFDAAEAAARASLEVAPEEQRVEALIALGMTLSWAGRPLDAVPHLEQAVEAAGDLAGQARAHWSLGIALSETLRRKLAERHIQTALELYERLGDRRGRAEALNVLAANEVEEGDAHRTEELLHRAAAECREIGYRYGEAVNLANLGVLYRNSGRVPEALRMYEEASVTFRAVGERRAAALVQANRASLNHSLVGDDEAALTDAEAALAEFAELGHGWGEALCLEVVAFVERRAGRVERARGLLEQATSMASTGGVGWVHISALRSLALLEIEDGNPEAGLRYVGEAEELCARENLHDVAVRLRGLRSLALTALGSPDALDIARDVAANAHMGLDQAYLLPYWHYLAAQQAGCTQEAAVAIERSYELLMAVLYGLEDGQRRLALSGVPEHAAILAARASFQPSIVTVALAAAGAPTGRPLGPAEMVQVRWTVEHPDDRCIEAAVDRRRARLLRLTAEAAAQGAAPTVNDLAAALEVSVATVRRDLAALRADGHDAPTRGSR